jgi:hypothetical protein
LSDEKFRFLLIVLGGFIRKITYIDESIDSATEYRPNYVLVASILKFEPEKVLKSLINEFNRDSPFKAAKFKKKNRYGAYKKFLTWGVSQVEINLIVAKEIDSKGTESTRQECLTELLIQLDSLEIKELIMDSRKSPLDKSIGKLNSDDLLSLKLLSGCNLVSRDMRIFHRTDDEDFLISIPDSIAWIARKFLKNDLFPEWAILENNSKITIL